MAELELKNVSKIYNSGEPNQTVALKGIDLAIEKGEMLAVLGTSGAGKSTLLNILGCLDKPDAGTYSFCGEEVNIFTDKKLSEMRNAFFGHILQSYGLIDSLSVYDNIKIPLVFSKTKSKDFGKKIAEVLEMVNLKGFENKLAGELSGGQAQRVAIARALVNSPRVIFADEPTGALDSENTDNIMELFRKINGSGVTVVVITHDEHVASFCKRKIVLSDGKIQRTA